MDKSSIIGMILGIIAVGVGMIFKGVSPIVLFNPAALLIILLGTAATITIAFPSSELKRLPKLFGIIFKEQSMMSSQQLIRQFTGWAELARKEGLLALESKINEVEDPFLKNGLSLTVDGQNADYIRDVMNEELSAMEERHGAGASMFVQAGTYAPTLGVLGAVIGLIAALSNMNDTETLGHAISAAFVATLLGIFTGYVLWHPFANKLKRKSKQEVKVKEMMIEGVLSILEGEAPRVLEQKLASYLPAEEKRKLIQESGEPNE
ncbi:flagellar motor stator protein MotA [Bacillus aerolatus]|uniref:Flagellar motor stator protein MotA n=1 Tax=Bacillus aerolatus TaxID=2653354 RepID=A0A6I1FT43_9BACI|nr:flagellar motor stator protein MotA [Bacillus aerolatus]KAB7705396.1 flagellar motor stator protein MotA [Bacillus aerolatus]